MKRIASAIVITGLLALSALSFRAEAEDGKDAGKSYAASFFKVGVKGGIDFMSVSRFELGYISESVSSYTGFNAGVAFSFDLPVRGMTIQPELNYVSKGAMFRSPVGNVRLRADYVELPVNLQVGLDLILFRPYLMVSPYIGYAVYKEPGFVEWSSLNRFQYGIGIGGGIDFWRFQLQVKYNWNIGDLVRKVPEGSDAHTGIVGAPELLGSVHDAAFRGLEVSLVFFFW